MDLRSPFHPPLLGGAPGLAELRGLPLAAYSRPLRPGGAAAPAPARRPLPVPPAPALPGLVARARRPDARVRVRTPQEPFSCVRERIRSLQDKVSGLEGNNDILPCYSVRTGTVSVNILTEAVDSGTQRMKFFCGGR